MEEVGNRGKKPKAHVKEKSKNQKNISMRKKKMTRIIDRKCGSKYAKHEMLKK